MHAFAVGLTIICLCGIILVSGLGYWVARVGLHPVAQLSASAQALSASNRSQRLHLVPAVSELTPLVASFNGALGRLESAYAQLEGFSADVAHELRTPIGNMLGATQVMLTRERSAADLRDVLQSNLEELERLRAIVNDMLFLARADQGEAAQTLRQTRLSDEVKKTVEFLAPLIDEKALTVQTDGDVEALVDQALFRRAMTNLLHNAIQYSSPGSDVRVTMRAGGEGAEIAVSNVGTQIAAEHLNRLFDRFYRIDSSRASGADSHGLGLAIVKAIAHMHGGTVFASSSEGINTFGMRI
jgi:two-component system heavy metal sensor histidine kinase CusS